MITYRGTRRAGDAVVTVSDGDVVAPLIHIVKHSPDGFEWGYGSSGPAELARCLLIHVLGAKQCAECGGRGCFNCDDGVAGVPPVLYQDFKWDVIAKFPKEGWALNREEIVNWLRSAGVPAS
jgi:hypothetical protein